MTLLEYLKSIDTNEVIIQFDGSSQGIYINVNELSKQYYGERFIAIMHPFILGYIGCPFYLPTNNKENIQYIDGEAFEFLNKTNLIIDKEIENYDSIARRPYFRLRGKKVTEQQAFEIIRKTDRFFQLETKSIQAIDILHFPNWWFNKNHFPTHYGWCHPNGIIGINGITDKYPSLDELLDDMMNIKVSFPYLDFVVAITNWNEVPQDEQDWKSGIELGIWLHENTIEFMAPQRTRQIYSKYEGKYEEANKKIYEPEYYESHKIFTADLAYLKRCIEAYGIDPDEELEKVGEYIWKEREW